ALASVKTTDALGILIREQGDALWRAAVEYMRNDSQMDDRLLYWERLQYRELLKAQSLFKSLNQSEQAQILWHFELSSRGQSDLSFKADTPLKILITGFDPFFLDRNLDQSNPSGVTALFLDNQIIQLDGKQAEIQSLVVPVRYADFDQGMIEALLAPYYDKVDMIATISMGRKEFDLERFPGLRRSAEAPDNLNIYTGASKSKPIIPMLNGEPLDGPEFVEFSLPVKAMAKAKGNYQVIDNPKVETLAAGAKTPEMLTQLKDDISVSGSGGGYLSNEISYRSIRLRNYLRPELPVGHIHTPRIKAFEPETSRAIAMQVKEMLRLSLDAL
ncbi:MAG: hypothetical protein KJO69_10285, partial [Gammaproteobacteria bacterium]|nr:hypothetical protein [Gammaproteobacteria bacterium]NNJ72320.1 hypothetical protein [Enterobacterales bacterium]